MFMKKKVTIVAAAVAAIAGMTLVSCFGDVQHCTSDAPYWCSSAEVCCAYEYHDGHGTCWETMAGCRSTGYACTVCHLED